MDPKKIKLMSRRELQEQVKKYHASGRIPKSFKASSSNGKLRKMLKIVEKLPWLVDENVTRKEAEKKLAKVLKGPLGKTFSDPEEYGLMTTYNEHLHREQIEKYFPKIYEIEGVERAYVIRDARYHRTFEVLLKKPTMIQEIPFKKMFFPVLSSLLKEDDIKQLKYQISVNMIGIDDSVDESGEYLASQWANTTMESVMNVGEITSTLNSMQKTLASMAELTTNEGSAGLFVDIFEIVKIRLNVVKFSQKPGSSYTTLPKELRTQSIININNSDEAVRKTRGAHPSYNQKCFMFCILYHFYGEGIGRDPQKLSKYMGLKHFDIFKKLDRDSFNNGKIKYPIQAKHVAFFEKYLNVSIVLTLVEEDENGNYEFVPYGTPVRNRDRTTEPIHLLLHDGHYFYIKNFHALYRPGGNNRVWVCHYCHHRAWSEEAYVKHMKNCDDDVVSKMPKKGTTVKFTSIHQKLRVPYVIYADFECYMEGNVHKPIAVGMQVVGDKAAGFTIEMYREYVGERPEVVFLDWLDEIHNQLIEDITDDKYPKPQLTRREEALFSLNVESGVCWICKEKFSGAERIALEKGAFKKRGKKVFPPVRDHCHRTGKYRGAAHNSCNINYNYKKEIPVFFHNGRGYDNHLIIEEVLKRVVKNASEMCERKNYSEIKKQNIVKRGIRPLAESGEKFKTFRYRHYAFKDTFMFMNSSLSSLAGKLTESQFTYTRKAFSRGKKGSEMMKLMTRKGLFPYEYFDNTSKLMLDKLPHREAFYSKLTDTHISEEDYADALKIWKYNKCKTFEDYLKVYLKTDIKVLVDVFENFRNSSLSDSRGLDPAHFISIASLSWSTFLHQLNGEIGLIYDAEILNIFKRGMRGGICLTTKHYAEANNKYFPNHDRTKPTTYILYIDANNLYGKAMLGYLPIGTFESIPISEYKKVMEAPEDGRYGYQLVVDIHAPPDVQDRFVDYPPCPNKEVVDMSLHSAKTLEKDNALKSRGISRICTEKLHCTFTPKERYSIHYTLLQEYVKQGMVVTKVHDIIRFYQLPFMSSYITSNTEKRSKATSDTQKAYYKLLNNSIYGKTLTDPGSFQDIWLLPPDCETFLRKVKKPTCKRVEPLGESFSTVYMSPRSVVQNYPRAVGVAILDKSKLVMFREWCRWLDYFPNRVKMIITDTDSFFLEVTSDDPDFDLYEELAVMNEKGFEFDFSDYPKDHPLYSTTNKKVPGYFKDETNGVPIEKVVAIRPKCYTYKVGGKWSKTIKGITRSGREKVDFEDFEGNLFDGKEKYVEQVGFRTKSHEISTVTLMKNVFGHHDDDKRYQCDDGIHTLPLGYYKNNV